jgi:hypothetical protein
MVSHSSELQRLSGIELGLVDFVLRLFVWVGSGRDGVEWRGSAAFCEIWTRSHVWPAWSIESSERTCNPLQCRINSQYCYRIEVILFEDTHSFSNGGSILLS